MKRETADVLIIGGGFAAAMAALQAARLGARVLLLDRGVLGRSGSSPTSGGGYAGVLPETAGPDSQDQHIEDTLAGGEGVNDPRLVRAVVEEAPAVLQELEELGVRFPRHPDGSHVLMRVMGHTYPRTVVPIGGSIHLMGVLRREVLQRGVQVREARMVTRLHTSAGRVAGATHFDIHTGEVCTVTAGAVILAAGSATGLYRYASANYRTSGDALVLAARVGARLVNLEFVEFTLVPKVGPRTLSSHGISPFIGLGCRLVNARGERIMEKYDPAHLEYANRADLVRAVYTEHQLGNGPVYNDTSHFTPAQWAELESGKASVLDRLVAVGLDYRHERFEWVPAMHTCLGGIAIDVDGRTGVAGLYAAGECTNSIHGANRLSANAVAECLVFGKRAGRAAAVEARRQAPPAVLEAEIAEAEQAVTGRLGSEGEDPAAALSSLRDLAWSGLGVMRTAGEIEPAVAAFSRLRHRSYRAHDARELKLALEVGHLALAGEMIGRAAGLRTESRGQHNRADFPRRDDAEWRRWIVQDWTDPEAPVVTVVPVAALPVVA